MKKKGLKVVATTVALGLMAGTAFATSNISDVNLSATTALHGKYTPKYIAYEIYDATNGNNADSVPFYIKHDGTFTTDNQINIKGNGTNFNVSDQVYILANAASISSSISVPLVVTYATGGSLTVTLASTTGLAVGNSVTGPGIPVGATIATIPNATTITLSATTLALPATITTNTDTSLVVATTANLAVGMIVNAAGVTAGTTIASITNGTTAVLSAATTASAIGVAATFSATDTFGNVSATFAGTGAANLNSACTGGVTATTFNDQAASGNNNYYIVADGSQNSSPVNEITAKFVNLADFCRRNSTSAVGVAAGYAGTSFYVNGGSIAPVANGAEFTTAYGITSTQAATLGNVTLKNNGKGVLNLRVLGGLTATCNTTADVKAAVISNQGNIADTTVLQITPQFVAAALSGMQQELSTDDDFKLFVIGNKPYPDSFTTTAGSTGTLFTLTDKQVTGTDAGKYKAYVPAGQTATLQYTLGSISPETGVKITQVGGLTTCVKATDAKSFACNNVASTVGGVTTATYSTLTVQNAASNSVYSEMLPTNWTLSTFSFSVPGYNVCANLTGANVGNWYGGIEAIVPFVKQSASGYKTTIKLFNRYTKAAKLYVSNMNQVSDSIVTSITQLAAPLDSIASKSAVAITGTDLVTAAVLTSAEAEYGAPVKFLIRVPSQDGGYTTGNGSFTAAVQVSAVNTAYDVRTVAKAANVDPYINGVVVQEIPGGTQRSMSLLFKSFKQGQYGPN